MTNSNDKIKYFVYVRKSTEGDERQALSIDSQKDKILEFFSGLDVVEVLEEKHSAFTPYERPILEDMIKRIRKGEAQGVIAWHPDRLCRNEIDASTLSYMVRTGIIQDLKFVSYNFDNSPEGIMMLQLAMSQSQYFSSKLGKDVKRGLEKKFSLGWLPNKAMEGYYNKRNDDTGISTIVEDKERFILLRKAFDLMLTGIYTVPEILTVLNEEWGYKTRRLKSFGGKELSRTSLYRVFTNPFYAGIISYAGKEGLGKHLAMISLEEFDKIQAILGRDGKPRQQKDFAFTGLIHCKKCDCMITADLKYKKIKTTGEVHDYTYYRCTRKKRDHVCTEPALRKEELEKQIIEKMEEYELNPLFFDLALEIIEELRGEEKEKISVARKTAGKTREELANEIKGLTKMKCKDLLSDEEFISTKNELSRQMSRLGVSENIKEAKVLEITQQTFELACHGIERFKNGDNKTKRKILCDLGSNWTLEQKKLEISAYKWLLPIKKNHISLNTKIARLELAKTPIKKGRNELLDSLRPVLRRARDSNP